MTNAYVDAAIRGEMDALSSAANGDRNNVLFKVAARLYEFVEAGELADGDAEELLWREAESLGLAKIEIAATLKSARKRACGHPAVIPAERPRRAPTPAPTTCTSLDDYAPAHGAPPEVFRAAGWRETIHAGRPALAFPTATGTRYRYLDTGEKRYHSPAGYVRSWYRLDEAIALARETDQPIVLCNGEASTVGAQFNGVAAFAVAGGSEKPSIPDDMLAELIARWDGMIFVAFDRDKAGRDSAPQIAAQLRAAGYAVRVLDLNGGPGDDLADFCRLHEAGAAQALAALKELAPAETAPDAGTLPWRVYIGDAIDQIKAPRQLVKGYLAIGTVAMLIGPSEAGKSTVAVDIACKAAQHYGVVYVAGEDGAIVRAQLRAWELTHQKQRSPRLAVVDGPVLLTNDAQVSLFITAFRTQAPRLVVFDTLSTCTPGVDENSSDIGRAMYNLNRIADELESVVLVLHHPLKYDNGTFRGHSSILNDSHTMIVAQRDAGDDVVTLTVTRHKGPRAAPTALRLLIRETDIVDPDEGILSAPIVLPAARVLLPANHLSVRDRAILQYLQDVDADGGATSSEIGREFAAQFKVTEGAIRKDVSSLVKRGLMTAGEKQRDPRRITPTGSSRIKSDQVDQVDQVLPADPFVINTRLDKNQPDPGASDQVFASKPAPNEQPDPNLIHSGNGLTPRLDADQEKPDPTRSEPDPYSTDQVPIPTKQPDPPDPVLYTGSGGSGFVVGEETVRRGHVEEVDIPLPAVPLVGIDIPDTSPAGISQSYVRQMLAVGDERALRGIRTHCILHKADYDTVVAAARASLEEAST